MRTKHHNHRSIADAVFRMAAVALAIAAIPFCFPHSAGAAAKSSAVLELEAGTKIPLVSFSDSFTPAGGGAKAKEVKMGMLTTKFKVSKATNGLFKAAAAGKRIKSLKIVLQNGNGAYEMYTYSSDVVSSVRISGKADQAYETAVFSYFKITATGVSAGKTHPDSWTQGL